jgi:hypothetical protein
VSVIEQQRMQHLVIGHISDKNNTLAKVKAAIEPVFPAQERVIYACQQEGFDWLQLQ